MVPRANKVIVRTFPTYSSDPKGNNYCKYQLLKLKPWQSSPQNAWDNLPDTFISTYKQFLSTDYAKQHVSTIAEELHRAEQYESIQLANEDSDHTEETYEHNQEEWMLLCQLQPTYAVPDSHRITM